MSSPGPQPHQAREGRFSRGIRVLRAGWKLLNGQPRLLALPAIGMFASGLAGAILFVPVLFAIGDFSDEKSYLLAAAAAAYPSTAVGTFFNVAFLGAVEQHLRGETPTVAGGLRFARARIRRILVWALLATGVGLALRALAQLPIGDWVSSLLSFLGGLAWTAATLFVVPILVLEDVSAPKAVKQSARVFKQRYGEGITGQLSIGVVTGVFLLPTFILGGVAVAVGGASITVAVLLGLVAAVWFLCVTVVSGAVGSLFTLLLYREATEGTVLGPLTGIAPEDVLSRRRRASWRRRT